MKRKSIISMLLLSMMLGAFTTSCQDMLSPDSERHSYTVAEDTLYSYWGILKSLQNIAERYVILNECRGDLVDASGYVSDTIGAIVNFGEVDDPEDWKDGACAYLKVADYYHIINSCNAYIAMCDTMRTTGTNKKYMLSEYCQVKSIRAWVYMQLLYAYGENRVPFYKDPMLTTDDINNFIENPEYPKVTAQLLAEELGPELEELEWVEYDSRYGLPAYNNYGDVSTSNSHFVCHSSKCMFPISLVLGDLYLLGGKYAESAAHYYRYINTQECGPLPVNRYYCYGMLNDRQDYPLYYNSNHPFRETGAVSRSTEAITCIPSNKGKLEGKVLTDVCRLFGFEAQMSTGKTTIVVDGEEQSDMASYVILSPEYERELIPSRGYEALCDSQKYEIYVGTTSGNVFGYEQLVELRDETKRVGDARRYWIYSSSGQQWTFMQGDNILYGKMVSKQNPGSAFSTTYPVIYRKSTVWLRYAEALNRAGFPSYAFAILKTGLCNNPDWFPTWDAAYAALPNNYFDVNGNVIRTTLVDYPVKETDSVFFYVDTQSSKILPFNVPYGNDEEVQKYLDGGIDEGSIISTYADFEAWLNDYFQREFEQYNAEHPDEPMEAARQIEKSLVYWIPRHGAESFANEPDDNCGKACYYLDRREVERAASTPYLDFQQPYLRGQSYYQTIAVAEQGRLYSGTRNMMIFPGATNTEYTYTIGVHQRGCGFIRYDDPAKYGRSSYNYVKLLQKKIKENTGKEVTEQDIYSGNYDADIQDAVEDLIIDECALELAFEGNRFSDLCRVALRRGNPDYLAKRVAKRHTGEEEDDEHLRERLKDMKNWWLPLPEE